jgi:hypothetical protein
LNDKQVGEQEMLISRAAKFWRRDGESGMLRVKSKDYGDHWGLKIAGKHFIDKFKDFTVEIMAFPSPYYSSFVPTPFELMEFYAKGKDLHAKHIDVVRITRKKSPVIVDAHKWFSHGAMVTIHGMPQRMMPDDARAMRGALELLIPETRGEAKISEVDLLLAIQRQGEKATQKNVARALGVSDRALRGWLAKRSKDWEGIKAESAHTEIV